MPVRVINASGNLSLDNVTIRDGRVGEGGDFSGGGIRISNAIALLSPTLTITNSAFINNHSSNTGSGGALYVANGGQISITNSTFSGNSASVGGAILLVANFSGRPQANLVHVTVTNSTTRTGGDAAVSFDGQQTGAIRNSIIANNSGGACFSRSSTIVITASLIEGANTCGTATVTSDPRLGSLNGNYYPLLDTSPAIGAGNTTYCSATDQIGNTRPNPSGSTCDMGAIESSALDARADGDADSDGYADADGYRDTDTC